MSAVCKSYHATWLSHTGTVPLGQGLQRSKGQVAWLHRSQLSDHSESICHSSSISRKGSQCNNSGYRPTRQTVLLLQNRNRKTHKQNGQNVGCLVLRSQMSKAEVAELRKTLRHKMHRNFLSVKLYLKRRTDRGQTGGLSVRPSVS